MNDLIKRNWISFLGGSFLFLSFLYFLKVAIDKEWIPPVARAAIGIVLGLTGLFAGYTFYKKSDTISGETLAGLGTSVMYATFAYASFSEHIEWSTNALLVSMVTLTGLVVYVGSRLNMRILVLISLFGGLFTPLLIRANPDQDIILFGYVLVLNIAALWLSASKNWQELRIMSFLSTVVIYITYYILFEPESWNRPFFYASSLFFVYMIGLTLASWFERDKFEGLNLYLGLVNAVHYVFWSIFIFDSFAIPYALPTLIVGLVFLIAAASIFKISGTANLASGIYFLLGVVVIAIAGGDLGQMFETPGLHHVLTVSIWLLLCCSIYALGHLSRYKPIRFISLGLWGLIMLYWYSVAWDVEWIRWFGVKYIPFLNPGALVWIGMAVAGFIFSRLLSTEGKGKGDAELIHLGITLAMASHIVLGGLFTVQIQNIWEAYDLSFMKVGLALSISWAVYALLIFLWGAFDRNTVFRWMGSAVLAVTSLKVFIFDLQGEANMYKVLMLFVVGSIIILIGYVNRRWQDNPEEKIEKT